MPIDDQLYNSLISAYQAVQAPPDDEDTLLQKIMSRYQDPQRMERLNQLRYTSPEEINRQNQEAYFGKGKMGTLAQIIQTIGSGFGAPQPQWREMAMDRYKLNQQLAQQEETNVNKLAESEMRGIIAGRKNQADMAKAAMQSNSRERVTKWALDSKERIASDMMEFRKAVEEGRLTQQQAELGLKQRMAERADHLNTLKAMFPGNDLVAGAMRHISEGNDQMGAMLAKAAEARQEMIRAKEGTAPVSRQSQTVRIDPQTGLQMPTVNTTVTPGKPAQGNPKALTDLLRGGFGYRMGNLMGEPVEEQKSALAPKDAKEFEKRIAQVQQGKGNSGVVLGGMKLDDSGGVTRTMNVKPPPVPVPNGPAIEIQGGETPRGARKVRAFYHPPPGMSAAFVPPPATYDAKDAKAEQKLGESANRLNQIFETNFLNGKLDDRFSFWKRLQETAKSNLPADIARVMGTGDQTLETMTGAITEQVANYLKFMSGAQVSEQEFNRVRYMFAGWNNNPELLIKQAYSRMALYNAGKYFQDLGVTMTPEIVRSLADVVEGQTNIYYDLLKDAKSAGGQKAIDGIIATKGRGVSSLNELKDGERTAVIALQQAYQDKTGNYITLPYRSSNARLYNATVDVYIPTSWKGESTVEDARKKMLKTLEEEKKKREQKQNIFTDPQLRKAQEKLRF